MKLRALAVAGQALRGSGHLAHHVVQFALGLVIVAVLLVGALAWRLSQGPIEVTWLARKLETTLNPDSATRISIGAAAIAWEGYRQGVGHALDIRVADVAVTDPQGQLLASIPRADISLSFLRLLTLQIIPRAVEVDDARVTVLRAKDGSVSLDLGTLGRSPAQADASGSGGFSHILNDLTQPPQSDRGTASSRWAQLERVRISDAAITVIDRQLGLTWGAPHAGIDLTRRPGGGFDGGGQIDLALAGQTGQLTLRAQLAPGREGLLPSGTTIDAQLTPFNPSVLAAAAASLSALAPANLPLTLSATAHLDEGLRLVSATVNADAGQGSVAMGQGALPIRGAQLSASIDADHKISARLDHLDLSPQPTGPVTTHAWGQVDATPAKGGGMTATLAINVDHVAFADLPTLWPAGTGGNGTRPWITGNVVGGIAHDLHIDAGLTIPADFSDAQLTSVSGGLDGSDVTVYWLRPVPPIRNGEAHLTFVDPDTINIAVLKGRQGGLAISHGNIRVTGIQAKDQWADIQGEIAGPVADIIKLLKNPKIGLLNRRPIPMNNPSGQSDGTVTVTALPLRETVSLEDLRISTQSHLTDLHLGGIAAGRDLDHGALDIQANNDGLSAKGTATVSGIPTTLAVMMDFRDGPPTEVIDKVTASGTVTAQQFAANGLDLGAFASGAAALDVTYLSRRNSSGEIDLTADLSGMTIAADGLNYRKQSGAQATGSMQALLDHDRLVGVSHIDLHGQDIDVHGSADVQGGHPNVLHLQQVRLGPGNDFHGDVQFAANKGDPIVVSAAGASIDVSPEFQRHPEPKPKPRPEDEGAGTPFQARVKFDRVVTGKGRFASNVTGEVDNDGRLTRLAHISGATSGRDPFSLELDPAGGGRTLTAHAVDAGALLGVLDIADDLSGGTLTVRGTYDDTRADHPLSGTAEMNEFSVRGAPALAKALQAMTLYGLFDAVSGPGLVFSRMVAPFTWSGDVLRLNNARAYSSSLGLTAAGTLDIARRSADITGTIVPAYFFNSLLGRIPLVGKLFSPETGGGLFAATYSVTGPLASPSVSVNPLATLAPGFLRDLFGALGQPFVSYAAEQTTHWPVTHWGTPNIGNK